MKQHLEFGLARVLLIVALGSALLSGAGGAELPTYPNQEVGFWTEAEFRNDQGDIEREYSHILVRTRGSQALIWVTPDQSHPLRPGQISLATTLDGDRITSCLIHGTDIVPKEQAWIQPAPVVPVVESDFEIYLDTITHRLRAFEEMTGGAAEVGGYAAMSTKTTNHPAGFSFYPEINRDRDPATGKLRSHRTQLLYLFPDGEQVEWPKSEIIYTRDATGMAVQIELTAVQDPSRYFDEDNIATAAAMRAILQSPPDDFIKRVWSCGLIEVKPLAEDSWVSLTDPTAPIPIRWAAGQSTPINLTPEEVVQFLAPAE
ncbi:MAG: hypothetical protein SF028_00110 [Candidatus Sumerlaeia bacterium]|nr:hypothetical protein [Candidatus Sumerlaeia bacterium]